MLGLKLKPPVFIVRTYSSRIYSLIPKCGLFVVRTLLVVGYCKNLKLSVKLLPSYNLRTNLILCFLGNSLSWGNRAFTKQPGYKIRKVGSSAEVPFIINYIY
ncbi:hypothetical protein KIL84_022700 [Mauremys mutica]|uniref:Uncharacterized protein n=1 Tax=Mauremys mutica TaxID=74926 RepID=A0A9D3WNZ5_9SAUR|nr:hypothetical protein KIL84_022700 [Mauremys mutica]